MKNQEILKEFNETSDTLLQLVSNVNEKKINMTPFESSWTVGQIAEHLILSNSGFLEMLNGPVQATERPFDQGVKKIKEDFGNFTIKMQSPDFVLPPKKDYVKEELLKSLEIVNNGIVQAIQTLDLRQTCLAFELPVYGFMTRMEVIYFVIYHSKRHNHQLKNIINIFSQL